MGKGQRLGIVHLLELSSHKMSTFSRRQMEEVEDHVERMQQKGWKKKQIKKS